MSCQGDPIEMQDLRTSEQKQAMSLIFGLLSGGMPYGATPRQNPMSAPPDQAQMQGMNIMTNLGHIMSGGQQPYNPYTYQSYPYGMQPPIPQPNPYTYMPSGDGADTNGEEGEDDWNWPGDGSNRGPGWRPSPRPFPPV